MLHDNVIMDILPNDVIDIIYRYIHRSDFTKVFEELWDNVGELYWFHEKTINLRYLRKCTGCESWQLEDLPRYIFSNFVCEGCIMYGYNRSRD